MIIYVSGHINASRDLFSELVHQVMVSLLLHLNDDHLDERVETREASRQTLSKVLAFYSKTSAFKNVIQTHLGNNFHYFKYLLYHKIDVPCLAKTTVAHLNDLIHFAVVLLHAGAA